MYFKTNPRGERQQGTTTTQRKVQQQGKTNKGTQKKTTSKCQGIIEKFKKFFEENLLGCSEFEKGEFTVQSSDRGTETIVNGIRFKYELSDQQSTRTILESIYMNYNKTRRASVKNKLFVTSEFIKKTYQELCQKFEEECAFTPFFVKDKNENTHVIFVYEKVRQTSGAPVIYHGPPLFPSLHAYGWGGGGVVGEYNRVKLQRIKEYNNNRVKHQYNRRNAKDSSKNLKPFLKKVS